MADEVGATMAYEEDELMADADAPWGRLESQNDQFDDILLQGDEVTLGRNTVCTIRYEDVNVISGLHCKLFREGDAVVLQDKSSNGTFVDGVKVGKDKKKVLETGDVVTILKKQKANKNEIGYTFISLVGQPVPMEGGEDADGVDFILKEYTLGKTLGTGNFAEVKLGIHLATGDKYAVKCINKKRFSMQQSRPGALQDEVDILKAVDHENVIGIKETYETDETLYIVLEYVTGGELFDLIIDKGRLTEDETRPMFKQMLEAMVYLHEHGIAHRDLKPENILLKSKQCQTVKISDFGLSRVMADNAAMGTLCGTPQYIAPEILLKAQKEGYDKSVDMWSLGVILFVMLSGQLPFDDSLKELSIYDQIKLGLYSFPDGRWKNISESAKDICRRLMQVDPTVRWTAHSALNHPWVKGEEMVTTPLPVNSPSTSKSVDIEELKSKIKAEGRKATYTVMVQSAICSLASKDGSKEGDIADFIKSNFVVPGNFRTPLKKTLARMVKDAKLTPAKGRKGYKLKKK